MAISALIFNERFKKAYKQLYLFALASLKKRRFFPFSANCGIFQGVFIEIAYGY
jgi:hypothetical protein